jgi:hypothetical protein
MLDLIHKDGMPVGWVRSDGKTYPVFVCSKTNRPISPNNPGTIYWDPDTGDLEVLSDEAERPHGESKLPYSTELDVHSFHLFQNTAGIDGSDSQMEARVKSEVLGE